MQQRRARLGFGAWLGTSGVAQAAEPGAPPTLEDPADPSSASPGEVEEPPPPAGPTAIYVVGGADMDPRLREVLQDAQGVLLVGAPPRLVPGLAVLATAAQIGLGKNPTLF
jgi:hypothetical protein